MDDLILQGKLPEAFYRIQDLEAQKFVGKCLANVSERLSAKELLLDPFLATDQLDSLLPTPTSLSRLNFTTSNPKDKHSLNDQTKSTHMTITGTMNEEDDTVFLKVKIFNKNGMYCFTSRYNMYFFVCRYYILLYNQNGV